MKSKTKNSGFTLIEILVVIAIIGLLASVVMVSVARARIKASDARRIADMRQIATGLQLFYDKNGVMPANYNWLGAFQPSGNGSWAACDGPLPEAVGGSDGMLVPLAWNESMNELVTAGFLGKVPGNPKGSAGPGYCYYNFEGDKNAMVVTLLEGGEFTTQGMPPSCRPWPAGSPAGWCTNDPTRLYCMCIKY